MSRNFLLPLSVALGLLGGGCALGANEELASDHAWPRQADVVASPEHFSALELQVFEGRLNEAVQKREVAGLVYVLLKDDAVRAFSVQGRQAFGGAAMTENSIFRIRSMSKPITAVAMMQLYEKGLWRPEDPVTKFLPEMASLKVLDKEGETVAAGRAPTMRELMTHTAGFGYGIGADTPVDRAFAADHPLGKTDLSAMVRRTAEIPLLYQPGEKWSYSIAVDLQGAIVERLSGQAFGDYLQANIFGPLGMRDTGFVLREQDRPRFASLYRRPASGGELEIHPDALDFFSRDHAQSGGGGLVSTAHDYARFMQMLLNRGELDGKRILSPDTVGEMFRNQVGSIAGTPDGQGFGYGGAVVTNATDRADALPVGSYWWNGIDGTWFWIDPTNDLAFAGFIQRRGRGGADAVNLESESRRLIYRALRE